MMQLPDFHWTLTLDSIVHKNRIQIPLPVSLAPQTDHDAELALAATVSRTSASAPQSASRVTHPSRIPWRLA